VTELALVMVALTAAAVGYYEASKLEQRNGDGPWGLTPTVCGLACVVVGFLGAVIFEPLVVGAIVGVVCFNEVERAEELRQERLLGKSALLWSIAAGMLTVVVTILTSIIVVGVVVVSAALACGLVLMKIDRDELVEINNTLRKEKDELIAERRSAAAERSKRPPEPATPDNYSNAVAAALRAEIPRPSSATVVPITVQRGGDLLPGRR
jgi:hypothetical protein